MLLRDTDKWDNIEERVLTFCIFTINVITLVVNMVWAAYKLTPRE